MADDDVTGELVARVRKFAAAPLPDEIAATVDATLLHAFALAIGGSRYEVVDIVAGLGAELADGDVPLPGRAERLAPLDAAIAIATAAHHDDFDDTHLATVIHPGPATLAAVWAAGHAYGASGEQVRRAFAAGVEVQLRVGLAMTPAHYDDGWHITSTCGVIGAAVAGGLLAGLDDDQFAAALSIAADGTLGLRGAFRSGVKATHPGMAAANGLLAADLAGRGVTGTPDVLGADNGFFATLSPRGADPTALLDGWGTRWACLDNVFKPYPTGVVAHPSINAALELAAAAAAGTFDLDDIVAIDVFGHPLVRTLTGDPEPADGMAAKLSTPHGVAAALATGRAGLAEFTDAAATDPSIVRLRQLVTLNHDDEAARDSARLRITLADGTHREASVAHARGSLERPLTDDEFDAKITALIDATLPGATGEVRDAVAALPTVPDLAALARACASRTSGDEKAGR